MRDQIGHLAGKPHGKRQVAWDAAEKKRVLDETSGLWECAVCGRSMTSAQKESHLGGGPHAKEQARWEAERMKEKSEEEEERRRKEEDEEEEAEGTRKKEEEEFRHIEQLLIAVEKQENEKKLTGLRIVEKLRLLQRIKEEEEEKLRNTQEILIRQIQIRAEEEKTKNEESRLEELRRTEAKRIEEESRRSREEEEHENLRKAREVQLEKARTDEDERRRVEELRIQEDHLNAVREAGLNLQSAAVADEQLQIAQVKQSEIWIIKQEQEAAAAWQIERRFRMELADRRKEWMKEQEEEVSIAWRKEEQLRIVEENRMMECMRKQEEQAAAAWRMMEQVRIEQQDRRKQWMREQDEQAVADLRVEELLRIQEEVRKKEWMEKQTEAVAKSKRVGDLLLLRQEQSRKESQRRLVEAAANLTRVELLRKQSEKETPQKQVLLEVQERQQEVDRLTREQEDRIQNIGGQSTLLHNHSSPGSSIDAMGWLQSGIPSIQDANEVTGQEMHQQEWMPPYLVMYKGPSDTVSLSYGSWLTTYRTLPLPIKSASDIPPILYRVYDETSVSKYSWEGFTAAASCMPQDAFHFRGMVNLHGNWGSRESTPFISVTDSPASVAFHVEIRQKTRNQSNIMVALIDTAALLGQTSVWKMHDARDHFGLQPWKCHRRAFDNEYICALRIPAKAIVACCRPGYFQQNVWMFLDSLGVSNGADASGEQPM